MKRLLLVGVGCVALAACSQGQEPGEAVTGAGGLAFVYAYTVRLPSDRISAAQEAHASKCEQLGAPRCRITGMNYRVDGSGDVEASLAMALAAPLARSFGREGVAAVEAAGGALIGAEITGSDPAQAATVDLSDAPAPTAADAGRGAAEVARIDRQLARSDLSGPERAELTRQRAIAADQAQAGRSAAASARAAVTTTPVAFTYRAGRGVGAGAELAAAGRTAYASLLGTVTVLLTTIAALGPPLLVLLALFLLLRRFGVPLWHRLLPARPRTIEAPEQAAPAAGPARITPPPAG